MSTRKRLLVWESPLLHGGSAADAPVQVAMEQEAYNWWYIDAAGDLRVGIYEQRLMTDQATIRSDQMAGGDGTFYQAITDKVIVRGMYAKVEEVYYSVPDNAEATEDSTDFLNGSFGSLFGAGSEGAVTPHEVKIDAEPGTTTIIEMNDSGYRPRSAEDLMAEVRGGLEVIAATEQLPILGNTLTATDKADQSARDRFINQKRPPVALDIKSIHEQIHASGGRGMMATNPTTLLPVSDASTIVPFAAPKKDEDKKRRRHAFDKRQAVSKAA